MALLRNLADGRTCLLEPEHLVGRSDLCALRLDLGFVSAQHAILRWTGSEWELKDLGSRNGTFLDGVQLPSREPERIKRGARVAFGQLDQQWELASDDPPHPMIISLTRAEPLLIDQELLALPSAEDPQATIFRGSDGIWTLERADEAVVRLENQSRFSVGGEAFRFSCPMLVQRTMTSEHACETGLLQLVFSVSHDEEYVHVRAEADGVRLDLGTRTHNYVLLTLARHRLSDAAAGVPDTSCGWVYQDDLIQELAGSSSQLNIDVFRIRKQFAAAGLLNASDIVERRPRTHQLRIGVPRLQIVKI
jgi:hypothetical protein